MAIGIGPREARASQIDSIAVLPFVNESGNPDVEYLSDGMTESLINSLSNLPNLSVKARNSVFRYKGANIDEKRISQGLSVDALLLGRVLQRGDNVTLYLSLVDARTGASLWGEQYDRKMQDIAVLQKDIAERCFAKTARAALQCRSETVDQELYGQLRGLSALFERAVLLEQANSRFDQKGD